jgi:hypothetical protein
MDLQLARYIAEIKEASRCHHTYQRLKEVTLSSLQIAAGAVKTLAWNFSFVTSME